MRCLAILFRVILLVFFSSLFFGSNAISNTRSLAEILKEDPDPDSFSSDLESSDFPSKQKSTKSLNSKKTANFLRFDLPDCVRLALRNNAEIRAANYDIEESKGLVSEATPLGFPVLNYEYLMGPAPKDASDVIESFRSGDLALLNRFKLELGVPVFTFGKVKFARRLAKEGLSASYEKKKQKSAEIILKTKQLYYGLLLAKDLKALLEETKDRIKDAERRLGDRATSPLKRTQLKLAEFEVSKKLREVEKKERLAVLGLALQIGIDQPIGFEIADAHLEKIDFNLKDFGFYQVEAKRYRPESKLLDIALRAKENEYRLEKRKLLPNVGVGGFVELGRTSSEIRNVGSTNDFDDPFNFTRAGVGMRVNGELNFKQAKAKIKQKQAQYFKMSATKDYAEAALDLDLEETYLAVDQAENELSEAEEADRMARGLVFMAQSSEEIGVGEKDDFVESVKTYVLARAKYYEAIFNYNVSVATLISKLGYEAQEF